MKTLCSCQICNIFPCSQHHCRNPTPPTVLLKSSSTETVCQLTEYRDKFHHNGKVVKRNSKKVCQEYKPLEGKISATTTFKSDYVAHPPNPRSPKPIKAYVAPIGVMLMKTTYMNDFRMYPTHKSTIISKAEEYKASSSKMETLSVYNDVYRAWKPQPWTSYKNVDNLKVNNGTLDMTSTSRSDYCQKTESSRCKSFKPEQKLMESLPFEGKSVYQQTYVQHLVQSIPPKPKSPYKPSSTPFQDISIHRQDYKGDRSSAVQSCKVKVTWEPRSTPFEGKSECQDKFQAWSVKRVNSIRKAGTYSPPEGDMELTSTAHMDFRGAPGCPATTARPSVKAWSKGEPFEARSTTQDDFRTWEGAKRGKSVKPVTTRLPLSAFEGTSTFRAEFTPKKGENMTSFKPVQRLQSPCTMDCNTIYRSTFRKHEVQPCRACFNHGPEGQILCLGKNGHILHPCANVSPEEPKVITRPSTADIPKWCLPTNTRLVKSAGLTRQK